MAKPKEWLEYRHPEGLTRIKKKPVFLAFARCFYSATEAEDFIKSIGYTVKEVRKHHMKSTEITHYILDHTKKSNERI